MCSNTPAEKPGASAFMRNLRSPMPLGRKFRLFFRNEWTKVRTGKPCCGNYGEPGC
jgi:hypothetical protein